MLMVLAYNSAVKMKEVHANELMVHANGARVQLRRQDEGGATPSLSDGMLMSSTPPTAHLSFLASSLS